MRIIDDLTFTKEDFSSPAVTIGSYDGLHLGHQEIIKRVIARASGEGGEAVILTFEPHPVKFLHPQLCIPLITPYRKKMMLLIGPRWVVVGFNFTFGKDRDGTADELKEMGARFGFEVEIVPPFTLNEEVVSSTRIRELIAEGSIKEANRMLGRDFIIMGRVVHGHDRGKGLGFPTANLEITSDLYPKTGVYAATVIQGEKTFQGIVNIGTNPTFGDEEFAVEVFLFDYQGDLYGRELWVALVDRVRDEQTFPSPDALVHQIEKDVQKAKEILRGK